MEVLEISATQKKVLTVREIASQDVRKAEVFKRFGIEICCGGIMPLETACLNLKLDLVEVQNELRKAISEEKNPSSIDLEKAVPEVVVDYLYNKHHVSFYKENKLILDLLDRVQSHVKQYPVLKEVNAMYLELQKKLINNFLKKEKSLFSEIKKAVALVKSSTAEVAADITHILTEIEATTVFHLETIGMLKDLSTFANNFIAPEVACNSFKLLYHKLKGLEQDLLAQIDVGEAVLFPKVVSILAELQT